MLGAHRSDANLAEAFVVTRFDDKKIGHAPVCADDGSYFQQVWNIRQKVLRRGSLSEDQAVPVDVSMEEFEDSVICNARTYSPLLGVLGEYDPIVDICVIFPNQNEKIPAGYECLIRTPFGHRGDCNSGVVGGEGVFICVKRSSRPSPHFKDNSSVIVDIKVVFMDKEAVPKGYDLIKTSRSGAFSANLNYGYLGETIYLAVKRCPVETLAAERYHSLRPIVGVCIINQTKGETVPVGFEMIDKSTSHGNWTGNKMYICIRRGSGYGMLDNMFAATLSDRVPKMDDEDFSLPQGVELFTAPTGIQLKRREVTNVPLPEFFSLVLTLEDGSPLYISCFTFYEMLEDDVVQELETHYDSFLFGLARSNKDPRIQRQIEASISCGRAKMNGKGNVEFFSLTEQPLKTPKADPNYGIYSQVKISIVSRFPFYREYKQFLMLLYQVSISRTTLPLERYVGHFLFELPLPKPGKPGFALGFGGGDMREIQFSLPPRQGLGFCSINFETVFRCLDFERFIDLYCLLLLERRVVVHSSHLSVLNEVMEGMRILMFPLDWQSTYIPVCPAALWENITAPVPFFIGLETRTLVDRSTQLPTDVWEVSLDENKIYYWDRLDMTTPVPEASLLKRPPGAAGIEPLATVRSGIQAPKPPIALLTPFKRDLKNAVFDSAPTLKTELGKGGEKLFGQSEPDMAYSLSPLEASGAEAITSLQESVRLCCVRLIVELIGHYQDFLLPPKHTRAGLARPETSPTNLPNIFNVSGFLEACPKTLRPFVSEITTTLSFTNFIDERTFSTQAGFGFVFFDKLIAELRTSPTARSTTFGWGKALGSAPSESERTLKRPSSFSVLGASSKQSFTNSKGQTFSTSFTGMIKSMSTRKSASSKSSGNITPEEEKKVINAGGDEDAFVKVCKEERDMFLISFENRSKENPWKDFYVYDKFPKVLDDVLIMRPKRRRKSSNSRIAKKESEEKSLCLRTSSNPAALLVSPRNLDSNGMNNNIWGGAGGQMRGSFRALVTLEGEDLISKTIKEEDEDEVVETIDDRGKYNSYGNRRNRPTLASTHGSVSLRDVHRSSPRRKSVTEPVDEPKMSKQTRSKEKIMHIRSTLSGIRMVEELERTKLDFHFAFSEVHSGMPRASCCFNEIVCAWITLVPGLIGSLRRRSLALSKYLACVINLVYERGFAADEAACRALLATLCYGGPAFAGDADMFFNWFIVAKDVVPNAMTYGYFTQALALRNDANRSKRRSTKAHFIWTRLKFFLWGVLAFRSAGKGRLPKIEEAAPASGTGLSTRFLLHSGMTCAQCMTRLLDSVIMQGWEVDEEQESQLCPYCATVLVPVLGYTLVYTKDDCVKKIVDHGQCEYMNPLVFRQAVERFLEDASDMHKLNIGWQDTMNANPSLFFNMLWFFSRLGLPPLFHDIAGREKDSWSVECFWEPIKIEEGQRISEIMLTPHLIRTTIEIEKKKSRNSLGRTLRKYQSSKTEEAMTDPSVYIFRDLQQFDRIRRDTLWGNIDVKALLSVEVPTIPESIFVGKHSTTNNVFRKLREYLDKFKVSNAIRLFLSARMCSRSDDPKEDYTPYAGGYVCQGWECFSNSIYVELRGLMHLNKEEYIIDDLDLERAISKSLREMDHIDPTLASYVLPKDYPPTMCALAYRTYFPSMYP